VAFFNYVTKEITLKVVYYGPGLSGKTTNLQHLYSVLDASSRGKFISLATESDRTLFFDFLPVELGKIKDFSVRFQLYTVPGQIRYNATRKLVLKGADAVVFVADSQKDMREQNLESLANMKENLAANNLNPDEIPVVLQCNKRDLPNILSIEELENDLNQHHYQVVEAVASQGKGVQETFRLITSNLLKDIARKHRVDISPAKEEAITVKLPEKETFDLTQEVVPPEAAPVETRDPQRTMTPHAELSPQSAEKAEKTEAVPSPPVASAPYLGESPAALLGSRGEAPLRARSGSAPSRPVPRPDEDVSAVLSQLKEMNHSLIALRETVSALSREIRATEKQQADMMRMLRDLNATVSHKVKDSWWSRLFSR
jgi:signal recognition particle receptor subunit beta